jgi:hypothetical protein
MGAKTDPRQQRLLNTTLVLGGIAILLIPINWYVFWAGPSYFGLFVLLALAQAGLATAAAVSAGRYRRFSKVDGAALGVLFGLTGFGAIVGLLLGVVGRSAMEAIAGAGGAWGRPLRLRGRVIHPKLRIGDDWTRGATPSVDGLDEPTRRALEALWLHDAQKEHASVPAFARLSWILAGVGAPADLIEDVHRAALEEIDHARRCFALAAGYGRRRHTAEPMPDLLLTGLELRGDPLTETAVESLKDGCLLEDYNADVAAACVLACEEPVTRAVLEQIAREERSHAELSWRIVELCVRRGGRPVRDALLREAQRITSVPRPTAVSSEKLALVARADAAMMRRHGRLPDREWAPLWDACVERTQRQLAALLEHGIRSTDAAA